MALLRLPLAGKMQKAEVLERQQLYVLLVWRRKSHSAILYAMMAITELAASAGRIALMVSIVKDTSAESQDHTWEGLASGLKKNVRLETEVSVRKLQCFGTRSVDQRSTIKDVVFVHRIVLTAWETLEYLVRRTVTVEVSELHRPARMMKKETGFFAIQSARMITMDKVQSAGENVLQTKLRVELYASMKMKYALSTLLARLIWPCNYYWSL